MAESRNRKETGAATPHILVVDDSAQIRALLMEALQQAGIRCMPRQTAWRRWQPSSDIR